MQCSYQSRCTVALFSLKECIVDNAVALVAKALANIDTSTIIAPNISAAARPAHHPVHDLYTELSMMFCDEDILHFRCAEFTGNSSNADTLCKLQSFAVKVRRMLFTRLLTYYGC